MSNNNNFYNVYSRLGSETKARVNAPSHWGDLSADMQRFVEEVYDAGRRSTTDEYVDPATISEIWEEIRDTVHALHEWSRELNTLAYHLDSYLCKLPNPHYEGG